MAAHKVELTAIQDKARAKFGHAALTAMQGPLADDAALDLVNRADGLGLFYDALELAEHAASGVAGLPRHTSIQLAKRAVAAAHYSAAIGLLAMDLENQDPVIAQVFADAIITGGQEYAKDLTPVDLSKVVEQLAMEQRIELLAALGANTLTAITETTTADDAVLAAQICAKREGIENAAKFVGTWRELRGAATISDPNLVTLLDHWVAEAEACSSLKAKIDTLLPILIAVPRHAAARSAMQAARKELTLGIREMGAVGNIDALNALAETVANLPTALPEFDLWRARVCFDLGHHALAIDAGDRAAENLPDKINNWVLLMRSALHIQDMGKAISYAQNVVRLAADTNQKLYAEANAVLDTESVGV
jgi:tetratricopeptide (TPR) repeat protein